MAETMQNIYNAAFRRRLNQFIRESEGSHINFRNEKHRLAFDEVIRKMGRKNFALLSAVYLLTADHKLWVQVRNFVEQNEIKFGSFKPRDSTETGYTLYCCAKDLYAEKKELLDGIMMKYHSVEVPEQQKAAKTSSGGGQAQHPVESNSPKQMPSAKPTGRKSSGTGMNPVPPSRRQAPTPPMQEVTANEPL